MGWRPGAHILVSSADCSPVLPCPHRRREKEPADLFRFALTTLTPSRFPATTTSFAITHFYEKSKPAGAPFLTTATRVSEVFIAGQLWCIPLISALTRQRQADLCEFKASLVYRASSRTSSKATEKPSLKTKQNKTKQKTQNPKNQ